MNTSLLSETAIPGSNGLNIARKNYFPFCQKRIFWAVTFLCNRAPVFVRVCSVLPDDVEAKSEIRLPIFESCPLTNRPGMVGESTFSENPSLKVHCSFCQSRGSQHM